MPRYARTTSKSRTYHVIMRGINKQTIFEDDEDKKRFLQTLIRFKEVSKYEIYCYCIMDNHVHLLIKETDEPIPLAIKRISSSYVHWYNKKYERSGHLFQDRYRSENVEDEPYFLTVNRYIHQNPVKAGIVKTPSEFRWSSYNEYLGKQFLTETNTLLGLFSSDTEKAIELFKNFTCQNNADRCLEFEPQGAISDEEVLAHIASMGFSNVYRLLRLDKKERNKAICALSSLPRITIRQMARILGLSKSAIAQVLAKVDKGDRFLCPQITRSE